MFYNIWKKQRVAFILKDYCFNRITENRGVGDYLDLTIDAVKDFKIYKP